MASLEDKYPVRFTLKRLHSIVGLVVLGLFLAEHFFTNSFATRGADAYNEKVEFLQSLPYLVLIELLALGVPFAFHTLYGLVIIFRGSVNLARNNYVRNWAYVAQRVSAVIVMAFLCFHVYSMRFHYKPLADEVGFFQVLSGFYLRNPWVLAIYVIGISATFFHLANGICTFCMTWGLTIGPRSQRLMAGVATVVGLAFLCAGIGSLYGFLSDTQYVEMMKEKLVALLF